ADATVADLCRSRRHRGGNDRRGTREDVAVSGAVWTWWIVIFAVGSLNYLSRLSFIALFARVEIPPFVARALRFVPAAMLTAIVVPAVVFTAPAALQISYTN